MKSKLKNAARESLEIQDACNLAGVVKTFSKVCDVLWEHAHKNGLGTAYVNQHPIVRLYVNKLLSLAGDTTSKDWDAVYELAKENVPDIFTEEGRNKDDNLGFTGF